MNCTRMIWRKVWIHPFLQNRPSTNSLRDKDLNKIWALKSAATTFAFSSVFILLYGYKDWTKFLTAVVFFSLRVRQSQLRSHEAVQPATATTTTADNSWQQQQQQLTTTTTATADNNNSNNWQQLTTSTADNNNNSNSWQQQQQQLTTTVTADNNNNYCQLLYLGSWLIIISWA